MPTLQYMTLQMEPRSIMDYSKCYFQTPAMQNRNLTGLHGPPILIQMGN